VARAREITGLGPQDSYASVAAHAVAVRAHEIFEPRGDVLSLEDIEPLHDMRVATRRLRAALEVFEPCFPRKRFRSTLRDVERLADALGERRDRDVQIAWLRSYAKDESADGRLALRGLIDELRAEQMRVNAGLASVLEEVDASALPTRLQELAARALRERPPASGRPGGAGSSAP
jgi:CHAD domain-containing protein